MEQFIVQTQHSGAINHVHNFLLPSTAVQFAKEVRFAVTAVAVAWVAVRAMEFAKGCRETNKR